MLNAVVHLVQEHTSRFVAPTTEVVDLYLGPVIDPRPAGEPRPVEYEDESGAA